MLITLENTQDNLPISDELGSLLEAGLEAVAKLHGLSEDTEVDITLVNDEEIHQLNFDYRNVDRPTDVLSFALNESSDDEPIIIGAMDADLLGDIIISVETAQRQADEFGHSFEREIVYLAVHGLLHLLGYDHMEESDKIVMRKHEEEALRAINLSEEFLQNADK